MYAVQGKNCILYAYKDSEYIPFACGQELGITEDLEILPTTTVGSGKARTFMTRFYDWKLNISGVMMLRKEGGYAFLDLFTDEVRTNGLNIKAIFTDDQEVTQEFTGTVLFPSKSVTGTVGQIAKWTANMQGTGAYALNEFVLPYILDENGNPILDENGDPITIE